MMKMTRAKKMMAMKMVRMMMETRMLMMMKMNPKKKSLLNPKYCLSVPLVGSV